MLNLLSFSLSVLSNRVFAERVRVPFITAFTRFSWIYELDTCRLCRRYFPAVAFNWGDHSTYAGNDEFFRYTARIEETGSLLLSTISDTIMTFILDCNVCNQGPFA